MKNAGHISLVQEAEYCRLQAKHFADKPEGPFLMGLAKAFDSMAEAKRPSAPRHQR